MALFLLHLVAGWHPQCHCLWLWANVTCHSNERERERKKKGRWGKTFTEGQTIFLLRLSLMAAIECHCGPSFLFSILDVHTLYYMSCIYISLCGGVSLPESKGCSNFRSTCRANRSETIATFGPCFTLRFNCLKRWATYTLLETVQHQWKSRLFDLPMIIEQRIKMEFNLIELHSISGAERGQCVFIEWHKDMKYIRNHEMAATTPSPYFYSFLAQLWYDR